jgi:hypothetical protein
MLYDYYNSHFSFRQVSDQAKAAYPIEHQAATRRTILPNHKDNEPFVRHYQAELLRRADHYRLVTSARPRQQRQWTLWFRLAVAWFGRRLIVVGQAMQPRAELPPAEEPSAQNI